MLQKTINTILREYDACSNLYAAYGSKLEGLIKDLLDFSGIAVHSVAFRCKLRGSLQKKLGKQDAAYSKLSDITDICGLRIITYFDDEVRKVSQLLESEFEIDDENSSDKALSLDPDRFGYLSMHYVVSNSSDRRNLKEYTKFNGLKAEIQVRSILQHAWAEIEHDLGYKSQAGIPKSVRRRFSRLAGLLELADQEFRTIRGELADYSGQVLDDIKKTPANVDLDAISLKALIGTSKLIKRIDLSIAKAGNCTIEDFDGEDFGDYVDRLRVFDIHTIDALLESLETHEKTIVKFAKAWLDRHRSEHEEVGAFPPGTAIFYLAYVLALTNDDPQVLRDYVGRFNTRAEVAQELQLTFATL